MFNSSIKGRFTILYLLGGAVTLRYVLSLKTCNRVFESRCGTFFFLFPRILCFLSILNEVMFV